MKLKDYVTLGNLLAGLAAVIALMEGSFDWACNFIYIAYAFDVLDGPVARLTKQHDTFGAHLDTACDYVTNSIAAPFLLYHAFHFQAHWPIWISAIIALFPAALGTIRQARGYDEDLSYPCYWLGLPRPALALFFVAILNSSIWTDTAGLSASITHVITAVLVVGLSLLHVSRMPFNSNKYRRWMGMMWFGRGFFLLGAPLALVVGLTLYYIPATHSIFSYPTELFFDHLVVALFIYIFLAWTQIPKEDFRRIKHYLKTKEVIYPLVHVTNDWKCTRFVPFFYDDVKTAVPTEAPAATQEASSENGSDHQG